MNNKILKLLTWPNRVTLQSALHQSPRLKQLLEDRGFEMLDIGIGARTENPSFDPNKDYVICDRFCGMFEVLRELILPGERVLIRWSAMEDQMEMTRAEMIAFCKEGGHVLFYDDKLVTPEGNTEGLVPAVEEILDSMPQRAA